MSLASPPVFDAGREPFRMKRIIMNKAKDRRNQFFAGVLGALALAALAALCLWVHGPQIPADISARAGVLLKTVGLDPTRILSVDGRDVILRGEADRMVDRGRLLAMVRSVRGVRTVSDRLTVNAPEAALFTLRLTGGRAVLTGLLPSRQMADKLADSVSAVYGMENVDNQLDVNEGMPPAPWLYGISALIRNLAAVASPVLEVTRTAATLAGSVTSEKERDLISREFTSALNGQVPFENRLEVNPSTEAIRLPEAPPTVPAASIPFPTLRFKLGSTELTDESLPLLDQVAAALKARPGLRLELAAHTDASGSPSYNLDLSTRRAMAVLELLQTKGIDERRLEPKGYGETRPLADNLTPRGAELNRRIEFIAIE